VLRAVLLPLALAAALPGCGTEGKAANDNGALPALTGRLMDNADLLAPEAEARISAKLVALEKGTTDQLVVVTVPTLNGAKVEDFLLRLGRGWGIGRKDVNNGVLLVVAPTERRVRIEVGYGLEGLLTDEKARMIIDETIPEFATGNHAGAIEVAVDRISRVLAGNMRRPQPVPTRKAA
jgi:uncharacterized protein